MWTQSHPTKNKKKMVVLLTEVIYEVRRWDGLRWRGMYITSFMKTDTGVQAILKSGLRNLRGCNAGITDRRDL
jgi:hypothetical protein